MSALISKLGNTPQSTGWIPNCHGTLLKNSKSIQRPKNLYFGPRSPNCHLATVAVKRDATASWSFRISKMSLRPKSWEGRGPKQKGKIVLKTRQKRSESLDQEIKSQEHPGPLQLILNISIVLSSKKNYLETSTSLKWQNFETKNPERI